MSLTPRILFLAVLLPVLAACSGTEEGTATPTADSDALVDGAQLDDTAPPVDTALDATQDTWADAEFDGAADAATDAVVADVPDVPPDAADDTAGDAVEDAERPRAHRHGNEARPRARDVGLEDVAGAYELPHARRGARELGIARLRFERSGLGRGQIGHRRKSRALPRPRVVIERVHLPGSQERSITEGRSTWCGAWARGRLDGRTEAVRQAGDPTSGRTLGRCREPIEQQLALAIPCMHGVLDLDQRAAPGVGAAAAAAEDGDRRA